MFSCPGTSPLVMLPVPPRAGTLGTPPFCSLFALLIPAFPPLSHQLALFPWGNSSPKVNPSGQPGEPLLGVSIFSASLAAL